MTIDELAEALRTTLMQLRISGELDITVGDDRSVSFVGQPGSGDLMFTVRVESLQTGSRVLPD